MCFFFFLVILSHSRRSDFVFGCMVLRRRNVSRGCFANFVSRLVGNSGFRRFSWSRESRPRRFRQPFLGAGSTKWDCRDSQHLHTAFRAPHRGHSAERGWWQTGLLHRRASVSACFHRNKDCLHVPRRRRPADVDAEESHQESLHARQLAPAGAVCSLLLP